MNTDITTPVSKTDWPSLLDLLGAGDVSLDENFRILFCSAGGPGALVRLRGSELEFIAPRGCLIGSILAWQGGIKLGNIEPGCTMEELP
jgi:hypothetical protein